MPTYTINKRARFDYEILETVEGGLVLTGPEVKSIRTNSVQLGGSFITFHNNIPYLTNIHIPPYKFAGSVKDYEPERSRVVLLRKKEIDFLRGKSQEDGLTIVPLSLYTKGRRIKIEIAVARGKKKFDKRETIKKRELDREVRRSLQ